MVSELLKVSTANEDAFRTALKTMAALAVETFSSSDTNADDRYDAVKVRANATLSFANGAQSLDSILTELTTAQIKIGGASERHDANFGLLQGFVDDKEHADIYEVGTQLLALSGRVEASLQVSASLGRLSLLNFL